ncbi:AraC family transcriptional regulator [Hahella aquimaris]|uniref:helix-turn-helix domain-containing protein n=1 Tax=Hahella sp. HNIBRBA332 TaxID=3015983 RepID=UPI00273B2E53|nr:AraC family transcriptional regulator [Hahella sp. HNIBRBA332]WLQ13510.1 AraC family transcriptional regulator [Hahella sp. HNIBRBA332]
MHATQPIAVEHGVMSFNEHSEEASHAEHVLSLVLDGSARIRHGDDITLGAGVVTLVPAGMPHRLLSANNLEAWWLGFCAGCLDIDETHPLMSPFKRVRSGMPPMIAIEPARRARLLSLFADLREECQRNTPETGIVTRCLLLLILAEINRAMRTDSPNAAPPADSLTTRALEYIQGHCLEKISLQDVAAAVHRTPAHVAAAVKKSTGFSVGEWITRNKLQAASLKLAHTGESVDKIAGSVGWGDVTHFIRQFKKHYGSTPAAWRKQVRVNHRTKETV